VLKLDFTCVFLNCSNPNTRGDYNTQVLFFLGSDTAVLGLARVNLSPHRLSFQGFRNAHQWWAVIWSHGSEDAWLEDTPAREFSAVLILDVKYHFSVINFI